MKYNVLIVDDEALARKLLSAYVEKDERLALVGMCATASEAFAAIRNNHVDILLLDIHLPDTNGLDLARTCKNIPVIIFTTAYSEHALESYSLDATDYLLKPISPERFKTAIEKGIRRFSQETATVPAAEPVAEPVEFEDYMMVKADYKLNRINFNELKYIEGQHEYVTFHLKERKITALYSLKKLEEQLPEKNFMRVHKSYIVNLNYVTQSDTSNVLLDDISIPIGGSYKDIVKSRLK